jgi:hypothetical protein
VCRELQKGKEDCQNCTPECPPEGENAVIIYLMVRNQIVFASAGLNGSRPIDLSVPAVLGVMDLYEVDNPRDCFEKVMMLGRYFINEANEKIEAEA